MVDVFATKLNHKLPRYVSPVRNSQAVLGGSRSLCVLSSDLDPSGDSKMTTYRHRIMIAPGWPGMS